MSDGAKMSALMVFTVVFTAVAMHYAGYMLGCQVTRREVQREAVKAGAAHWVAGDDGGHEFQWAGRDAKKGSEK